MFGSRSKKRKTTAQDDVFRLNPKDDVDDTPSQRPRKEGFFGSLIKSVTSPFTSRPTSPLICLNHHSEEIDKIDLKDSMRKSMPSSPGRELFSPKALIPSQIDQPINKSDKNQNNISESPKSTTANEQLAKFFISKSDKPLTSDDVISCLNLMKENTDEAAKQLLETAIEKPFRFSEIEFPMGRSQPARFKFNVKRKPLRYYAAGYSAQSAPYVRKKSMAELPIASNSKRVKLLENSEEIPPFLSQEVPAQITKSAPTRTKIAQMILDDIAEAELPETSIFTPSTPARDQINPWETPISTPLKRINDAIVSERNFESKSPTQAFKIPESKVIFNPLANPVERSLPSSSPFDTYKKVPSTPSTSSTASSKNYTTQNIIEDKLELRSNINVSSKETVRRSFTVESVEASHHGGETTPFKKMYADSTVQSKSESSKTSFMISKSMPAFNALPDQANFADRIQPSTSLFDVSGKFHAASNSSTDILKVNIAGDNEESALMHNQVSINADLSSRFGPIVAESSNDTSTSRTLSPILSEMDKNGDVELDIRSLNESEFIRYTFTMIGKTPAFEFDLFTRNAVSSIQTNSLPKYSFSQIPHANQDRTSLSASKRTPSEIILPNASADSLTKSLKMTNQVSTGFNWSAAGVSKPLTTSTWECKECLVKNTEGTMKCISCDSPKIPSIKSNEPISQQITTPSTSFNWSAAGISKPQVTKTWECKECFVRNKEETTKCISCESLNLETASNMESSHRECTKSSASFDWGAAGISKPTAFNTWECQECFVKNKQDALKCISCESKNPKKSIPDTPPPFENQLAASVVTFGSIQDSVSTFGQTSSNLFGHSASTATSASLFGNWQPSLQKSGALTDTQESKSIQPQVLAPSFSFGALQTPAKKNQSNSDVGFSFGDVKHFFISIYTPTYCAEYCVTVIKMKQILTLLVCIVACALSAASSPSTTGSRILVLVDSVAEFNKTHSVLYSDLSGRGFDLTIKAASDRNNQLLTFGERNADHLIMLAANTQSFSGDVNVANIIQFLEKGGNVLVSTSSQVSEFIRDLSIEFSVDFDDKGSEIVDYTHSISDKWKYSTEFGPNAVPFLTSHKTKKLGSFGPIVFNGIAHRITGKNPLVVPILTGHATASSFDKSIKGGVVDPSSPFVGTRSTVLSALQTRNNSRIIFAGCTDLFSDLAFKQTVAINGKEVLSGNHLFVTEILKWVLQEKRVLKFDKAHHHKQTDNIKRGAYRIKDDLVFQVQVSEWEDSVWNAYTAEDLQFEAVMLDPYIRKTLSFSKSAPNFTEYEVLVKLPDQYGVFTFKIDYKRHGYTWIETSDLVEIRPFRHNEYPRFLVIAYPYYVNAFSMLGGFVIVSILFLYHKDPESKVSNDVKGN